MAGTGLQGRCAFPDIERIFFGIPAQRAFAEEVEHVGARNAFVLSTRSLAVLADGPLQRIEAALGPRRAGSFSSIAAHSPDVDVIAAAAAARRAGADLLIAVAGGSVIDATKAVLWCLWHGIDTVETLRSAEPADVAARVLWMVAVPTTLSAAEFMPMAGVLDRARGVKRRLADRGFAPRSIVLDPEATLDTPLELLLSTGIRAIDHAVETHCAPEANWMTEVVGLRGLAVLAMALRRIADQPHDLEARVRAQLGMWQCVTPATAGVGVGASHGIGYAAGARFGMPHGRTSCVLLGAVLRWNAAVNAKRQEALAEALGATGRNAADLIVELVAAIGLPTSQRQTDIPRSALPQLAADALAYEPVHRNPRPIRPAADVEAILELAW